MDFKRVLKLARFIMVHILDDITSFQPGAVANKIIISSALPAIFLKMLTVPQIFVNSKIVVDCAAT